MHMINKHNKTHNILRRIYTYLSFSVPKIDAKYSAILKKRKAVGAFSSTGSSRTEKRNTKS